MKQLNLPEYSFNIKVINGEEKIFDILRRKFVKLTGEEWVRQHFIRYLSDKGKYPVGLMGSEMQFGHNKLKKRTDILVHDRTGRPVMIVECKSPDVSLSENVFEQIVTYNLKLKVPYLVVTNGVRHYACRFNNDFSGWDYLLVIPLYEEVIAVREND